MLSLITEFVLRLAYWRKPTSFSAPSKAHSSQLLLPHSHPRRLSESSCTETTCSFSTVCITLPQKKDKVNRNSSCLIRFLQKSLRISCQLFYTTPTFLYHTSALPRRSRLPPRSVLGAPHRGAAPEAAAETSPSAPARKPAKTLGFRRFSFCTCCMGMGFTLVQTLGFPIRSHLFPTAATPSSTQNAPDFSYFRLKSGAFRCFCLLLTCKNFVPVFLRHPGFPAIHIDSF